MKSHPKLHGVPKKFTFGKKCLPKSSAEGSDFPQNMTLERLILFSLIEKRPKNIFPDTGGAGITFEGSGTGRELKKPIPEIREREGNKKIHSQISGMGRE